MQQELYDRYQLLKRAGDDRAAEVLDQWTALVEALSLLKVFPPHRAGEQWTVTANFCGRYGCEDNHDAEERIRATLAPETLAASWDSEMGQLFAYTTTELEAKALTERIAAILTA